jgi:hypothetical protein
MGRAITKSYGWRSGLRRAYTARWCLPEGRSGCGDTTAENDVVASYSLNEVGVAKARQLIDARQYVLTSTWADVQPSASDENAYLESHSWEDYAQWHLGLTDGATDGTKARYAFGYGDFRRLHRIGLIACVYRAAEWRHKEVEVAAYELLQYLDAKTA